MTAKKLITWGKMREVRKYYLGPRCELSGVWCEVVMHHGYNSRRISNHNGNNHNGNGRSQSIFDGQLRSRAQEAFMHFYYGAGNNERSLRTQEENNYRLFELLRLDYLSGRELPFGPEVQQKIPKWLEGFPEWLKEFKAAREPKNKTKAVVLLNPRRHNQQAIRSFL